MRIHNNTKHRKRGATFGVVVLVLPVLLGFAALTVDVGMLYNVKSRLQQTADACAHDAVLVVTISALLAKSQAQLTASTNYPSGGQVLDNNDILIGNWDTDLNTFTAGGSPNNAVKVTTRQTQDNDNPVEFLFASIFGIDYGEVSATATAYAPIGGGSPPFASRFLLDDEMFDTDVPAIEDFADDNGYDTDELLTDDNNDGFIDFPPTTIELPTGQVGDAALFELGPDFEFTHDSHPSLEDFLLFEEGENQHGILKSQLDPLMGVDPVYDPDKYPDFVSATSVHVSPVYKSDVSNTDPGVNALGERRGLVAFKIIAVGTDPDGNGSELPNLIIEIIDPLTLGSLDELVLASVGGGGSGSGIVQLVE